MKLSSIQIRKIEELLTLLESQTYPEEPSEVHDSVTSQMMDHLFSKYTLPENSNSVLDIGCGQGVALEKFASRDLQVTGITLNQEDVEVCRRKGFDVYRMDQSFLEFEANSFGLVWCRHCIEHSFAPMLTLFGIHQVLVPGGLLYIEVPAPDTAGQHQTNPNHYSVMQKSMWSELIKRTGFVIAEEMDIDLELSIGKDRYLAFIATRP